MNDITKMNEAQKGEFLGAMIAAGGSTREQMDANTRLLRLRDTMLAAERANPYILPEMPSPPTVTVGTSPTLTVNVFNLAASGALLPAANLVRWLGGNPKAANGTQVVQPVSTFFPALNGNMTWAATSPTSLGSGTDPALTADMNEVLGGFTVMCNDSQIEFRLYLNNTQSVVFQVDGQYVNKAGVTSSTNSYSGDYYKLDFGTARVRKIRVMLSASPQDRALDDPSLGLQGFFSVRSIAVRTGYSIWRPSETPKRLLVFGDSYSTGVGGGNTNGTWRVPGTTWPAVLGDLLGFEDVRVAGAGGTGYFAAGSGRSNMVDAFPRLLEIAGGNFGADLAVIGHGYKDRQPTITNPTQLAANIREAHRLLRSTDASLPIVVLGAQAGSTGPDQRTLDAEAMIKAAVEERRATGDKLIAFAPVSPSVVDAWTFGTGNGASPNGSGPADIDVASDSVHPTTPGAAKIGARAAAEVRRFVDTMLTDLAA